MPEQNLVQVQAKSRPKIEEIIPQYLDGDSKKSITELLEYCKANKITTPWSATNRWKIKRKGELIGMIYIGKCPCMPGGEGFEKNVWYIHISNMNEAAEKENMVEVVHRNITPCALERKVCDKPNTTTILGKEFKGMCPASGRRFANPDAELLDLIKRALILDKGVDKP